MCTHVSLSKFAPSFFGTQSETVECPTFFQFRAKEHGKIKLKGTLMWKLLIDPHIACCVGSLGTVNSSSKKVLN